jgi:K+-sensing histidine kinase KdpD
MSRFNPLLWPKPPVIWRYGIAVLSVAAAPIISRWPAVNLGSARESLLLCAVMISAWLGGIEPGLLPTVLSCLALNYYSREPLFDNTNTKPQGTGIGLAIIRSIIDALGARLWAEKNKGRSATYLFNVPAADDTVT